MYPTLGIDVSKAKLDVALAQDQGQVQVGCFENNPRGYGKLQRWLERQGCDGSLRICLEATGRYSDGVAEYFYAQGYWVGMVTPRRSHFYAKAQPRGHKTDRQDAKLLAHFCATQELVAWTPLSLAQREHQELARHLNDLKTNLQQVRNRLGAGVRSASVQRNLHEQQALLERQIADLEQELHQRTAADAQQQSQVHLLCTIPGIGPLTAQKFLAEVPDVRRFADADQLAAYAGLVPRKQESGSSVRKSTPLDKRRGNKHLRTAFYMPALRAEFYNPIIANLAQRLRARGKSKMEILGAIMHKLLVLAYGVLKSGVPFDPNYAHTHTHAYAPAT